MNNLFRMILFTTIALIFKTQNSHFKFLLIFIGKMHKITKCQFRWTDRIPLHGLCKCGHSTPSIKDTNSMAKRRGNPNWGKPEPIGPVAPTVTSFEQIVKEFKLPPDQYIRSTRLREWARRNKNSKYIPEALLEAWGFEIESTL
jgi:hypothetical protein